MPFDGKNFTETKLEPFSLDDLIAWLETQPKNTAYDFTDPEQCLWAHYTIARGGKVFPTGEYRIGECTIPSIRQEIWRRDVANGPDMVDRYGDALSRALALQAR